MASDRWLPVNEAPDRREVLIGWGQPGAWSSHVAIAYRYKGKWRAPNSSRDEQFVQPTVWRDLPHPGDPAPSQPELALADRLRWCWGVFEQLGPDTDDPIWKHRVYASALGLLQRIIEELSHKAIVKMPVGGSVKVGPE